MAIEQANIYGDLEQGTSPEHTHTRPVGLAAQGHLWPGSSSIWGLSFSHLIGVVQSRKSGCKYGHPKGVVFFIGKATTANMTSDLEMFYTQRKTAFLYL